MLSIGYNHDHDYNYNIDYYVIMAALYMSFDMIDHQVLTPDGNVDMSDDIKYWASSECKVIFNKMK